MKTATAERLSDAPAATLAAGPLFVPDGPTSLRMRAGAASLPVTLPRLDLGADYYIELVDGSPIARKADGADIGTAIGGFHFAPGGNATARAGGDEVPAINPFSCWDGDWRPACADPRGMTCVELAAGKRVWVDIYLLGCNPWRDGTSRFGVQIADGDDLPMNETDEESYDSLDHPTAVKIYAGVGKQLLSVEEFFAAAYGVTEATSIGEDPETTKLDAPRTSKWGVMQATGNMSTWGNDGDPDGPNRACRFGGFWVVGDWAGSRLAHVGGWPVYSLEWLGARGRSDHLSPDTPAR